MTVAHANPAAERLFGWRLENKLGSSALELVHHDDVALALSSVETVAGKDAGSPIELRVRAADEWLLVELTGTRYDDDGQDLLVLALRDIGERRRWEIAHDDNAAFRAAVHHAGALLLLVDPEGFVRSGSAAVMRDLGHDPERVQGVHVTDLVHREDRPLMVAALDDLGDPDKPGRHTFEARLESMLGRAVPYQIDVAGLGADPTIEGYVVSGHDISQLDEARRQLSHNAAHDRLTGLLNRAGFLDRLSHDLAAGQTNRTLAFIDLDHFKPVNDRWGHAVGDRVLAIIARRIEAAVRGTDYVGRIGGDEFAMVVAASDPTMTSMIVERVEAAIAEPITLADDAVDVTATVGTAVVMPGSTAEGLLAAADARMYEAKAAKRAARTS